MSGELKVPADPLLHERSTEAAREADAEAEEPKNIYADSKCRGMIGCKVVDLAVLCVVG